jgi:rhomboid family GlyGly-CTERM serine protease
VNDTTNQGFALRRYWLTLSLPQRQGAMAVIGLAVLVLLLSLLGEPGRQALRYQRDALLDQHQYWRLFTGHWVHGSWHHTWLNLAGLALIVALFHDTYSLRQWWVIGLASMASIDLGLLLLMPQLDWYVGLSGLLHGLLAAGAVAWWRIEARYLAAILSAILLGKLSWEQWQGALPLSGELEVIVNAHLYGAIGGLLAGLVLVRSLRSRSL